MMSTTTPTRSVLLLLLLLSAGFQAVLSGATETIQLETAVHRLAQEDVSLQASYVGEFQYLRDAFCLTPEPPILRARCGGTLTLIDTSDPTITCEPLGRDEFGRDVLECTAQNEDLYVATDGNIDEGPFGQVFFRCEGEDLEDVYADWSFEESQEASCATLGFRVFRSLRLGVTCDGSDTEYMYDDYFFECAGAAQWLAIPGDGEPGHELICAAGTNCRGEACPIPLDQFFVISEVARFQDRCVTPPVPVTSAPTAPPASTAILFQFTAQFVAFWGILFDEVTAPQCFGNTPSVQITCLDGGTIEFVGAVNGTATCSNMGDSVLECIDNSTSIANDFTGVRYSCSGEILPKTTVEYPEEEAFCDGNFQEASVHHAVQLGVYCGLISDYFYGDFYTECGDSSHEFLRLDESAGTDGFLRHTCTEEAVFASGSTPADSQTLSSVSIMMDTRWNGAGAEESCYDLVRVPAAPSVATSPPVATTSSPTKAPTRAPFTEMPSGAPVTGPPSAAPVASSPPPFTVLTAAPAVAAPMSVPTSDSSSGTRDVTPAPGTTGVTAASDSGGDLAVGPIVGGIIGGFLLLGVIIFFALRNQRPPPTVQEYPKESLAVSAGIPKDHSHTGSATGFDPEARIQEEIAYNAAAAAAAAAAPVPSSPHVAAAANVSQTSDISTGENSTGGLSASSLRRDGHVVDYKDQARSVMALNAVATSPNNTRPSSHQYPNIPQHLPQRLPMATAMPMDDDVSAATENTRQSAEPDGRYDM